MGNSHSHSHSHQRRGAGGDGPPVDIEAPPPPERPGGGGEGGLEDAIDRMVDEFMESDATNSAYLPDFIESRIYRNGLRMGLGLLRGFLGTLMVEFAGLRVSVSVE
jgi:hypothetical protein